MRRSNDVNPVKTYSNLNVGDAIERRDIATAQTAGAVDLKIKQDLFAKDIAYDGHSKTHLSQASDRDKNINCQALAETTEGVTSAKEKDYRKTLENFQLVNGTESGELQMSPQTDHEAKRKHMRTSQFQTNSSTNKIAQTLFAYPDGFASIENVHHESNRFVPR